MAKQLDEEIYEAITDDEMPSDVDDRDTITIKKRVLISRIKKYAEERYSKDVWNMVFIYTVGVVTALVVRIIIDRLL